MRRFFPDIGGLPRAFWFLWAGTLVNRLGGFVFPFLSLYLTEERKLDVEQVGLIISLFGLGSVASGPTGGFVADRLGRRPALALATILGGSAMLALGFARSPAAIAPLGLLLGFCGELYRPVSAAIIADVVPPADRTRAYGLQYWAVNLGFAIALPLAGLLAKHGYMLLFIGDAATTFLFGTIVWWNVPESLPTHDPIAHARAGGWFAPYRDLRFLAFIGVALMLSLVFLQGHMTMPIHLHNNGVSGSQYGWLMSINGVMIVLLQPIFVRYVERFRRGQVLGLGALLTGCGFGLLGVAGDSLPMDACSVVVWTLGEIAMAPVTPTVIADLAPPSLRGVYQGAYLLSWGSATFLAPIIGSHVMGRYGAPMLWGGCVLLGCMVAVGYLLVSPERRSAMAPQSA